MKLLFALLLLPGLAFAQSSVWKVSNGTHELYLGGTIHVLSKNDYPLPDEFMHAYAQAERLVFEVNLTEATSPQAQQQMFTRFAYPPGATLAQTIRPDTLEKLKTYASTAGVPIESFLAFKPQFVSLMITMAELRRIGINVTGVDQYFELIAKRDGKPLDYLESLTEQMDFIANMGKGREDELLIHTIEEARQISMLMSDLISSWRTGDTAALNNIGIAPMKEHFPEIYEDLIVKRNNNWMTDLDNMLKTPQTEYVLVGALHLVGEDGLLTLLEKRGYHITQL